MSADLEKRLRLDLYEKGAEGMLYHFIEILISLIPLDLGTTVCVDMYAYIH